MSLPGDPATAQAWAALGGQAELAEGVSFDGAGRVLAARLPARELARATVGACSLAAAELLAARNGGPVPPVLVREGAVATAFTSERHLRIDGGAAPSFAPLSGFWPAADGWVRTHANYPHHRARLLDALGIGGGGAATGDQQALAKALAAALAARPAAEIQETVYAAGGLAVAVAPEPDPARTASDAAGSGPAPLARPESARPESARPELARPELAGLPLIEARPSGPGDPRPLPPARFPADGVRVLDLTRVIAGPVATRTLALLGADVLRVDPPRLPEDPVAHADTGTGKRSAQLDLSAGRDLETFEALLAAADVVVTGYRPGALDRYGLSPDALLARRPGLIVAQLSAWGWSGAWAGRRGFDSLVQAASGIAAVEATGDRPGVLPAQVLDHGTGYLLAAAILRALTSRQATGSGGRLRLSLAGTACWLLRGVSEAPEAEGDYEPGAWLAETDSPYGRLRYARPPIGYLGAPAGWDHPPTRWGTDRPCWTVTPSQLRPPGRGPPGRGLPGRGPPDHGGSRFSCCRGPGIAAG